MMISPELYYDENFKGKSAEEIMRQIRSSSISALRITFLLYSLGALPPICLFDSGNSGVLLTIEFHFSFLYPFSIQ